MTKSRTVTRKEQGDDLDEGDISQLQNPIQISGKPVQQILNSVHYGSPELRSLLMDECDLIFECKICRALFRDLPNFISHKRVYCKKSHLEDTHVAVASLPEEKVVVVLPKAPEETEKSTQSSSSSPKKKGPKSTLEQTIERIQLGKSHAYQVYTEAAEKLQRQKEEMKVATIRTTPIPTNKNAVFMEVDLTSVNIHECQKASAQNASASSANSHGVVTRKRGEKSVPSSSSLSGKCARKTSKPEKHSYELQKLLMQELKEIQKQKAQGKGDKSKGGLSRESRLRQRMQEIGKTSKKELQLTSTVKQMNSSSFPSPKKSGHSPAGLKSSATLDLARQNFQTVLAKPGNKTSEKYEEQSSPGDQATVKRRRKGLVKNDGEKNQAKLKQINSRTLTFSKHKKVRNSLVCVTCNTIFSSKNSLSFHKKIHHSGKRTFYPCPYCSSTFYYFFGVTRHLSQSHCKSPEEIDRMRKQLRGKSYTKSFSIQRQTSKKAVNKNPSARRSSRKNDNGSTQMVVITPKRKLNNKQPREAAEKNLLNVVASVLKQQAKVQKTSEDELKAAQANQSPKSAEQSSPGSAKTKSFNNSRDVSTKKSTSAEDSRSKRLKARQLVSNAKVEVRSQPRRSDMQKSSESTLTSSLLGETDHTPTFYTCKKCQRGFGRKISFENHTQVCKTNSKAATPKNGDIRLETLTTESVSTSAPSRMRGTKPSEVTSMEKSKPTLPETPVRGKATRDGSNDSHSTTSSKGSALERGTSPQGKPSNLRENDGFKKQDCSRSRSRERKPAAESTRRDSSSSSSRSGSSRRRPVRRVSPSPLGHLRLRHAPVQKEAAQNKSTLVNKDLKKEFEVPKMPFPDEDKLQTEVKLEGMCSKSDLAQNSTRVAGNLDSLKNGRTESPVTPKSPLSSRIEEILVKEDKDVNCNSNGKTGTEESKNKSSDFVDSLEATAEKNETSAVKNATGAVSEGGEKEEELQVKEETDSDASTGLVKRKPDVSNSIQGQKGSLTVVSALSERPKRKRKVPMRNLDAQEMLTKIHRPIQDVLPQKRARLGRNSSKKRNRVRNDGKNVNAKTDIQSSDEYSDVAEGCSHKEDRGEETTRSKGRSTSSRIYVIGQKKGEARRRNVQCYDLSRIGKFMDSDSLRCLECGGKFSTVFNIRRHVIRCHLRWSRFKCKLCKFQSFDISECKTHISRNHSITAVNRAGRSVSSLIIDLTKQGSQARNLKKSQTIKGKLEVESKAGNIYARPTTRRFPRLPERSSEKSVSPEEEKNKYHLDKDKGGEQRKEEVKTLNATEVGKQKSKCIAGQIVSKSVIVKMSPEYFESQTAKGNPVLPVGNRKSLPFNISTRNSPRVFDTRPYKVENTSSSNHSPVHLETRKGTYIKPTAVSPAGGRKQAVSSSDKAFLVESSDVIDAAKVLASLNDKPKEGGYSALTLQSDGKVKKIQLLPDAIEKSDGTPRFVRTAFSESISHLFPGCGTIVELGSQPVNNLQQDINPDLIKSLTDTSSSDLKKVNSPTSTKATISTEQSKLPITSTSPTLEGITDSAVSNDIQESNVCLKNAQEHSGGVASASRSLEKPVSPTSIGLAGKSSIVCTKRQSGKVLLYTAKVPERSGSNSALTTPPSTSLPSKSVSISQSSSNPSASTSLTYDTNLVPSGTFVIRKHFI